MLRGLALALTLMLAGSASVSAVGTETLAALDPDFRFASPTLDAERFDFGGHTWIRTDKVIDDARAAGAVRWSYEGAAADRFFLIRGDAEGVVKRLGLERVGAIGEMQVLRLPASSSVDVPHFLAFHEIRSFGTVVPSTGSTACAGDPDIQAMVNAVDEDSLYAMLDALSSIQTRHCRSSYFEDAVQYAETKLEGYGWIVERQIVEFSGDTAPNLIATKLGTTNPETVVILCGHLDSTTFDSSGDPDTRSPGADDNGSSSVAILETARVLKDYTFENTIKLVLFTAEEIGLRGSRHFVANAVAEGMDILAALNGDMIAYDTDAWDVLIACNAQSSWVGDITVDLGTAYTPSLLVEKVVNPDVLGSDHSAFWEQNLTCSWFFEGIDYSPYIHTTDDLITTLNLPFYTEATRLFMATIACLGDYVIVDVADASTVPSVELHHYPEPASGSIRFLLDVLDPVNATLRVYDVGGRFVADLGERRLGSGLNRVVWDSRTASGALAPAGVYVIKLEGAGSIQTGTQRVTIVR